MFSINPYEQVYRKNVPKLESASSMKQAEQMSTHMSLMYNAFGICLKDVVGMFSLLYKEQQSYCQQINIQRQKLRVEQAKVMKLEELSNLQKLVEKEQENVRFIPRLKKKYLQQSGIDAQNTKATTEDFEFSNQSKTQIQMKSEKANKFRNLTNFESKSNQFTRIQKVINRQQRQNLNGYSCTMCQKFYKALGQDYTDKNGGNKLCNDCSRHRSNLPPTTFFTEYSQQFGFDN